MIRPIIAMSARERPVNGRVAAAATSPSKLVLPFVVPVPATPVDGGPDPVVVGVVVSVVVVGDVVVVSVDVVGVVEVVGVVDVVGVVEVVGVVDVVGVVVVVVVVVVVSQTLLGLLRAALSNPWLGCPEPVIEPGAGPRMRSTWKKQSGNATVRLYVPPPANIPSLLAKNCCGNEYCAFGIE
jgi:hypothetical protein